MSKKSDGTESQTGFDPLEFGRQWVDMSIKAQRAMTKLAGSQAKGSEVPAQLFSRDASAAFGRMFSSLLSDPATLGRAQFDLWQQQTALWQTCSTSAATARRRPVCNPRTGAFATKSGRRTWR